MNELMLWFAVALPIAAAVSVRFAPAGAALAPWFALLTAFPTWLLLIASAGGEVAASGFTWLPAGGLDVGLRLDGLAAAMSATVATVGLIVVFYAGGYFDTDPRRRSALAGLLAFLGAMQGLVLAGDYLTMLIFWELVGAASARLIAFSRSDPAAARGAVRAFLTTRSADVGFYLAVLALFTASGSLDFVAARPEGAFGDIVALGLITAAIGKSAQVPLQTWLSAAMTGPTPVSALLHSGTMVAAGVYLLSRSHGLLAGWPLEVVGWIGAATAVLGAGIALAQTDLKRILAGSTSSQLGFMFVGLAAGGPAVAMFQLIAHAAGKAGMFLAAGVFQHNRGTTSLADLQGAGRKDRLAFAGFVVGALSIASVPPFAAFWSKEHIAAAAGGANEAWFVLVILATIGSAAYLLRPILVLWRNAGAADTAPRGRKRMLAGIAALGAGSLTLGLAGGPLASLLGAPDLPASGASLAFSLAAVVVGVLLVLVSVRVPEWLVTTFRAQFHTDSALRFFVQQPVLMAANSLNSFERRGFDGAVDRIGRGTLLAARGQNWIERRGFDAAVDRIGRGTLLAARAQDWVERRGFDAAVNGLARWIGRGGEDLGRLQSGRLYEYLRWAVLGGVAIAILFTLTALL